MNKKTFLKKLDVNLKYLTKEKKNEYLTKYQNIDTTDLNLETEINKIYEEQNIKYNIKFLEAMNIIIKQLKDKNTTFKTILFLLYIFIVIIFIKIPFIYVRDLSLSLFNNLFTNDFVYTLWNLSFELLYALAGVVILIRLIKNKALQFNYEVHYEK